MKELSELTNEELWQLFPVIISEYKDYWKDYYTAEEKILNSILSDTIERIHHIGSTAVPGLLAKPTIDILVEIKDNTDISSLIKRMEEKGYIYSPQLQKPPPHIMFLKGYTPQGFDDEVYHIHIRYSGDWDEVHFRDYLLSHPDIATEYGLLKLKLKALYEHDRDAYTEAKTGFIKHIVDLSRKQSQ